MLLFFHIVLFSNYSRETLIHSNLCSMWSIQFIPALLWLDASKYTLKIIMHTKNWNKLSFNSCESQGRCNRVWRSRTKSDGLAWSLLQRWINAGTNDTTQTFDWGAKAGWSKTAEKIHFTVTVSNAVPVTWIYARVQCVSKTSRFQVASTNNVVRTWRQTSTVRFAVTIASGKLLHSELPDQIEEKSSRVTSSSGEYTESTADGWWPINSAQISKKSVSRTFKRTRLGIRGFRFNEEIRFE